MMLCLATYGVTKAPSTCRHAQVNHHNPVTLITYEATWPILLSHFIIAVGRTWDAFVSCKVLFFIVCGNYANGVCLNSKRVKNSVYVCHWVYVGGVAVWGRGDVTAAFHV